MAFSAHDYSTMLDDINAGLYGSDEEILAFVRVVHAVLLTIMLQEGY